MVPYCEQLGWLNAICRAPCLDPIPVTYQACGAAQVLQASAQPGNTTLGPRPFWDTLNSLPFSYISKVMLLLIILVSFSDTFIQHVALTGWDVIFLVLGVVGTLVHLEPARVTYMWRMLASPSNPKVTEYS